MSKQNKLPFGECMSHSLKRYLKDLNGEVPAALYDMVISQVEKPLLEVVMKCAENNQTRAAQMLGLNRNTLRKKLRDHGLI